MVSMPSLMILRATRRRTGSVCSAMKTTPAAAFADLLEQLVVADAVAGFLGDGDGVEGKVDGGAGSGQLLVLHSAFFLLHSLSGRLFEEVVGGLGGGQQRLDALAQLVIASAGFA